MVELTIEVIKEKWADFFATYCDEQLDKLKMNKLQSMEPFSYSRGWITMVIEGRYYSDFIDEREWMSKSLSEYFGVNLKLRYIFEEEKEEWRLREIEDAEEIFPPYARIFREDILQGYAPLMQSVSKKFVSVVMLETDYHVRIALKDNKGQYYPISSARRRTLMQNANECAEEFDEFYQRILERDVFFKDVLQEMFPDGVPEIPKEILDVCNEDDFFGIYGENIWWWYDSVNNDLHFIGEGEVDVIVENISYKSRIPECIKWLTGKYDDDGKYIRQIVVHEGITKFQDSFMMEEDFLRVKEIVFPSSLKRMPSIGILTDKVVIPRTIEYPINFIEILFYDCGGHFDPITYSVRSLYMPSTVEINDEEDEAFPRAEPAAHLEEIVLYGENPIPFEKLDAWVKTSLFNLEIKIKYPKEWDEGSEITFEDVIVKRVQKENPIKLMGYYAPDDTDWEDWEEEDYKLLRERIEIY